MDRLTDEERVLAWKASWHPSFDGTAIVDKNFEFRSVNPQFCKLLRVTPAELIGKRFQDVTPAGVKELDQKNAELLMKGVIDFYLLPKKYQFSDGREVEVVLLVTRAPPAQEGDFQFFVSRIMLDENGELLKSHQENSQLPVSYQASMNTVAEFVMRYGKWMVAFGTILATIIITLYENLK